MQLMKGQIIELEIRALAFGGAGLGKYEGLSAGQSGLTVFVKKTMPGDKVRAAFTRIKSNFAEARLVEILKPSADRIQARCPYFGVCGGCQLQFMPYEKQLEFKRQQVIDSFERIGKIYNPPVAEIIGCKEHFFYRNKMEFSFGYDEGMNFALGMHLPGRRYDILNLKECYLQSELSVKIVNTVRDFVLKKGWEVFRPMTNSGFLKGLFIREGRRTNEMMVNLVTSNQIPEDFEKSLPELVKFLLEDEGGVDNGKTGSMKIVSIVWSKVIVRKGFTTEVKEKVIYGKPAITEKMILKNGDELLFDIFPQAFFQVNTLQAEILYSQVLKFGLQKTHNMALDLFCGTGTIGLFLAKHIKRVLGIELNKQAIQSAKENARKNNIFNIDFFAGDVSKVLHNVQERPSLIIVDPPRAGLTEKLIQKMNDFGADQIIYVSCNPSTLARDINWLKDYGYTAKTIQPVDMFPHTFHIECVCLLER